MLAWLVYNITIIACFTKLAIHFNKWWIGLFAALFILGYKDKGSNEREEGARQE